MSWIPYDSYLKNMMTGEFTDFIDHDGDTFKIALVKSSYTPNRAADNYWGDISGYEVAGTNYTSGGNACANPTVTVESNTITWDADDPATWEQSSAGFNDARYAILYKDSGTPSTSNLVAYHDFGSDQGNQSGDFTVQLDADGIATLGSS